MIRTSNEYWAVLKGGALMLLDKPPALNAKPMLCLKIVLGYSISVAQKGRSFEILAPEGEAIIATRFNERNEESEDVEIREYNKYTFEAESAEVAAQWTEALLDEFGEQDDDRHDSDGSGGGSEGDECNSRDGPTEQADDLRASSNCCCASFRRTGSECANTFAAARRAGRDGRNDRRVAVDHRKRMFGRS